MKRTLILSLIILIAVSSSLVQAKEKTRRAYMLTPEKIYKMAQDLVKVSVSSQKNTTFTTNTLINAERFQYYIAGLIDALPDDSNNKKYLECTRIKKIQDISVRSAIFITNDKFDRSTSNWEMLAQIYLSILFVCDDKNWK